MTVRNQTFTQRGYTSLSDIMQGGNLTLASLLTSMAPDANAWFGNLVTSRAAHGGRRWSPCQRSAVRRAEPEPTGAGAVLPRLGRGHHIAGDLAKVHDGLGDTPARSWSADRYALAALDALGRPGAGRRRPAHRCPA